MKWPVLCLGIAIGIVILGLGITTYSQEFFLMRRKLRDDNVLSSDEKFLEMVRTYSNMHRVTEKPYLMHSDVAIRCSFGMSEPGAPIPPDPFTSTVH